MCRRIRRRNLAHWWCGLTHTKARWIINWFCFVWQRLLDAALNWKSSSDASIKRKSNILSWVQSNLEFNVRLHPKINRFRSSLLHRSRVFNLIIYDDTIIRLIATTSSAPFVDSTPQDTTPEIFKESDSAIVSAVYLPILLSNHPELWFIVTTTFFYCCWQSEKGWKLW